MEQSHCSHLEIFSRPQVIENFRQYMLLRTDILQKTVVGCPWTIAQTVTHQFADENGKQPQLYLCSTRVVASDRAWSGLFQVAQVLLGFCWPRRVSALVSFLKVLLLLSTINLKSFVRNPSSWFRCSKKKIWKQKLLFRGLVMSQNIRLFLGMVSRYKQMFFFLQTLLKKVDEIHIV